MNDLARELTESLARGDQLGAIRQLRAATGLGLAEAKQAVEHFQATGDLPALAARAAPDALPPDVLALAERGDLIPAIKLLRDRTGLGLKDAKDAIDVALPGRKRSGCGAALCLAFAGATAAWLAN